MRTQNVIRTSGFRASLIALSCAVFVLIAVIATGIVSVHAQNLRQLDTPTPTAPADNPTPTLIPAPTLPPSDAFIPPYALTRYQGIPLGKTDDPAYPIGFPALGDPNAPLKITQVSSYSCLNCEIFFDYTIVNLLPAIRAGQVYFVFVPVLTNSKVLNPANATFIAFCALDQGLFWPIHDMLNNWQIRYGSDAANRDRLRLGAFKLGLNLDKLDACLYGKDVGARITAADDYVQKLGLKNVPAILINGTLQSKLPTLNELFGRVGTLDLNPPTPTPAATP